MQYVDSGLQITDTSNAVSFPDPVKAAIVYAFDNKQAVITQNPSSSVSIANYIPLAQTTLALMRAGYTSTPAWGQSLKRTAIVDINNSNNSFKTPGDVSFTAYMLNGNRTVIYSAKQMQFYYTIPPTIINLMLPSYKKPLSVFPIFSQVLPLSKETSASCVSSCVLSRTSILPPDSWSLNIFRFAFSSIFLSLIFIAF